MENFFEEIQCEISLFWKGLKTDCERKLSYLSGFGDHLLKKIWDFPLQFFGCCKHCSPSVLECQSVTPDSEGAALVWNYRRWVLWYTSVTTSLFHRQAVQESTTLQVPRQPVKASELWTNNLVFLPQLTFSSVCSISKKKTVKRPI